MYEVAHCIVGGPMKIPSFFNQSHNNIEQNMPIDEPFRTETIAHIKNLRGVSRMANGQVSDAMDTAIIVGGQAGGIVKNITSKTSALQNHIKSMISAAEEIAGNARHFKEEKEAH
jgi:hypothetical protein